MPAPYSVQLSDAAWPFPSDCAPLTVTAPAPLTVSDLQAQVAQLDTLLDRLFKGDQQALDEALQATSVLTGQLERYSLQQSAQLLARWPERGPGMRSP